MIVRLFVLYAFSVAATGLVAAFARHNRTKGWVRPRSSVMDDLVALDVAYDATDRKPAVVAVAEAVTAKPRPPDIRHTLALESEFAQQLVQLQAGVGIISATPAGEITPSSVPVANMS